jgi:flagellar motor component MotA
MGDNVTILGFNKFEKALIIVVPMILGAVIGWFIPVIADWVLMLPIVPMEKLIMIISSLNHLWVSIVASIIGVIAGFKKKEISAVYMENKNLVVLGQSNNELYREVLESKLGFVREAFHQHWYPWKDEDPFISQYQRWVLDHPDFPSKINKLLVVRERAIKEDKKKDAKYLREDLSKLGVVISDERNDHSVRFINGADNNAT